jgi:hypothetical protein
MSQNFKENIELFFVRTFFAKGWTGGLDPKRLMVTLNAVLLEKN